MKKKKVKQGEVIVDVLIMAVLFLISFLITEVIFYVQDL